MPHNNSPLFEKFYEVRGFDYFTPNLEFYNLHLEKEALHNRLDLPLYGLRAPPLKTSTFINIFSLVTDEILLDVGKMKNSSSLCQFLNNAKEMGVKAEVLYDVLSIVTYNKEYERLVKTTELRDGIIRRPIIDLDTNFQRVIQKLGLLLDKQEELNVISFSHSNYFIDNHFQNITRLVNITLENVYNSRRKHNLGTLENIDDDSIKKALNYLIYICILNNDCDQMIISYKKLLCSFNKLMTTEETTSLPIIIYLVVYSYKLLWIGASSFSKNCNDDEKNE